MKKVVVKLAVVFVVLMSVTVSVSAQSSINPAFLYDTEMENGYTLSKSICKLNPQTGLYARHLKYVYNYTDSGMPESRIAYSWDSSSNTWVCFSKMAYSNDSLLNMKTIEYAVWNKETETFDAPVSKAVYQAHKDLITSYTLYEKTNNHWSIIEHFDRSEDYMAFLANR